MKTNKNIPFYLLFILATSAIGVNLFQFNFSVNLGLFTSKKKDIIISWAIKFILLFILFIMFYLPQILVSQLHPDNISQAHEASTFVLRIVVIYFSLMTYRTVFYALNQLLGKYIEEKYFEKIHGISIEEQYKQNNIDPHDPDGEYYFEINYHNKIIFANYKFLAYLLVVPFFCYFITINTHYKSIADCLIGVFITPLLLLSTVLYNFHRLIDKCVTDYYLYQANLQSQTKSLLMTQKDYYHRISQAIILLSMFTCFNTLIYLILHYLDDAELGIFQRGMFCVITVLLMGFIFKYLITTFLWINNKIFFKY